MKNIPVYRFPFDHAVELGEEAQYRQSMTANRACVKAIEDAIREHTRPAVRYGTYFDAEIAVKQVVNAFGLERTVYVIANTIQVKDWDARFSAENKHWASTIPVHKDSADKFQTDSNLRFVVQQSHPVYVDTFAWELRIFIARAFKK
jgi:hypothetical protein